MHLQLIHPVNRRILATTTYVDVYASDIRPPADPFCQLRPPLIIMLKYLRLRYLHSSLSSYIASACTIFNAIIICGNCYHVIIFPSYKQNIPVVGEAIVVGSSLFSFHLRNWSKWALLCSSISYSSGCADTQARQMTK